MRQITQITILNEQTSKADFGKAAASRKDLRCWFYITTPGHFGKLSDLGLI